MPKSKSWWEQQGYKQAHPLHEGTTQHFKVPGRTETAQDQAELVEIEEEETGSTEIPLSYVPTRTSDAARPRTLAAGYDSATHTMRIDFREGATYHYYDVPPETWRDFKRSASPGKFMNRRMTQFAYGRVS